MTETVRPLVVADLTFARINGGRAYGFVGDDQDFTPFVGQHVQVGDGGSEMPEAIITAIEPDGTLPLHLPAYANRVHAVS